MGELEVTYLNVDAHGSSGVTIIGVKSALVDPRHRTLSVLTDGEEHYFNMNNVQSIRAEGVEITYA